jgi:hypothetical protein
MKSIKHTIMKKLTRKNLNTLALSCEEKLKDDFIFHRNTDDDIKNM